LTISSLSKSNKCMYSWLIDELQNQKWYLKSYKTQNWVTTIKIDFISYQNDISKIDKSTVFWPLFQTMNKSTKLREYTLSSNPKLQTLYTNSNSFTINNEQKLYINNFTNRLNEFCDNQYIYKTVDWTKTNFNNNNIYCVKDRIQNQELSQPINFYFNWEWNIEKINLDWRWLSIVN
jgi:hypothetical protein